MLQFQNSGVRGRSQIAVANGFPAFDLNALPMSNVFGSVIQVADVMTKGYTAFGREWVSFVGQRMQSDLEFAGQLAKCRTPHDLMQQWSEFCSTAGQAYQSELVKLSNIGTATVHELTRVMHPDVQGIKD